MKIVIDATPIAHGHSAVRRHSKNLIETLLCIDKKNTYNLLYIDRHQNKHRYAKVPSNCSASESIIPLPEILLRFIWQHLYLPRFNWTFNEFDILYSTGFYFPPANKGKVLATIHGIAYYIIEEKIAPGIVKKLKKALFYTTKHADYLLAVSQKTKVELIEYLNIAEDRIYVVSHGVDSKFKRLMQRDSLFVRLSTKLGFKPPYILFVGAIGHHKNIMGLLEAYQIAHSNGVDIPLVCAGPKGSAWEEAHKWVTVMELDKFVHFVGPISQDSYELTEIYNGACLFVFPSFYEGWTAPPLEAMACGVPVITSNCSSLPETVGDAAIKIDPHNPEELAFEIERVLSDGSLQQKLIEKGLEHVSMHTWESAASKFIEVFSDIQQRGFWHGKRR